MITIKLYRQAPCVSISELKIDEKKGINPPFALSQELYY
jgi:hypothetical protein